MNESESGAKGRSRPRDTHELNAPTQKSSFEVLVVGELPALEDLDRVDNRHPTIELSAWDVVLEILCSTRRTCRSKMSARGAREGLKENARAGTIQLHPLAYPAA